MKYREKAHEEALVEVGADPQCRFVMTAKCKSTRYEQTDCNMRSIGGIGERTKMNAQEIFDKSVMSVMEQNRASVHSDKGYCAYRGTDGLKCAVGHLIDDETAAEWEDMPSTAIGDIIALHTSGDVENMPGWIPGNVILLSALQEAHDSSRNAVNFRGVFYEKVEIIAQLFELKLPEGIEKYA